MVGGSGFGVGCIESRTEQSKWKLLRHLEFRVCGGWGLRWLGFWPLGFWVLGSRFGFWAYGSAIGDYGQSHSHSG